MADETLSGDGSTVSICPWCSASYTGEPEDCPSCGATLAADPAIDPSLPGLTSIDAAAIVRSKQEVVRPRNRLLSWISGEYPEEGASATETAALAPPDLDVRREILRLELEAEVADLQAEADALRSEAALDGPPIAATPAEPGFDAAEDEAVVEDETNEVAESDAPVESVTDDADEAKPA